MLERGDELHTEGAPGSSAALGTFAGFALLAVCGAAVISVTVPRTPAGYGLRAEHLAFEIGGTLGLGALSALAIGLWRRFVALPWWASAAVFSAACAPIQ